MTATQLQRESPGRFRVSGALDFQTVPELAEQADVLFSQSETIDVDLSGVTRADSAGVALLVEWMHEAHRQKKGIRYLNIPTQMLAIARVSSLDHILPLAREE